MQRSTVEAFLILGVATMWWVAFFVPGLPAGVQLGLLAVPCVVLWRFPWTPGDG